MHNTPPRLSLLDLVAVREGGTVGQALHIALQTARHAEQLGFVRYWLAEHHNMPGIASSATAVLVGHIAGGTEHIRVGSGGIMLPNHAPLVVAEAFGTLAELYPGRIDLGLGRAPGTDQATMRALRRNKVEQEDDFPAMWPNCKPCWPPATGAKVGRHAGRWHAGTHLAAGLQLVLGTAGGPKRPALCICIALCAMLPAPGACDVPQPVPALITDCP